VVKIFTTASFKAVLLELSRFIHPAKVSNDLSQFSDQTSDPLNSKA
jgi:hypothetical protein